MVFLSGKIFHHFCPKWFLPWRKGRSFSLQQPLESFQPQPAGKGAQDISEWTGAWYIDSGFCRRMAAGKHAPLLPKQHARANRYSTERARCEVQNVDTIPSYLQQDQDWQHRGLGRGAGAERIHSGWKTWFCLHWRDCRMLSDVVAKSI